MPQITANIKTEDSVRKARKLAVDEGVSLREWAGKIIESELTRIPSNNKRTTKKP